MNIAELFIRRPVMTTLVMLAIALFGIMGYESLSVSDLPNVDFPTITVQASYPGAVPETMASSVATPLERQFSTIAGVDTMISTSSQGRTEITLTFVLNRNIDAAALDVQADISRAAKQLPSDMPTPPSYQKVNPGDQPILYLALTSPTLPLSTLNEYGDTLMAQRISMVDGVAQVQVFGSQKFAVRVQADPQKLASRGIGIDELENAITNSNVNLPTGVLFGEHRAFAVQATGQLMKAADYEPVIVTYRNGAPVRLKELGKVIDSVENDKIAAWFYTTNAIKQVEGEDASFLQEIGHKVAPSLFPVQTETQAASKNRSIILAVFRQPGTNTVAVANAVKALLPVFRSQMPASVTMNTLTDRSIWIKDSANDVQFTLVLTLGLVVLVIFLFLRNVSATVIPSLALPMSVLGTFLVMYALDYSLDNLSLMALTLSVGFVVDDAIVMLENIVRHMEMGKSRLQAALDGAKEVGFTILSMTLSLAAVFIPVLFMSGIVGRLFREFAVTIGAAVLVSGFVSLTLTPMLSSRFLRDPAHVHHGRIYMASEAVFNAMLKVYDVTLGLALKHRLTTVIISLAVLGGTVYLFVVMPKGFLPLEDRDQILVNTEGAQGTSHTAMFEHQQALAAIVQEDPNILRFMSNSGSGALTNQGRLFIILKPRSERTMGVEQIVQILRPKLAMVPGISAFPRVPESITLGGRFAKGQYQYTLSSPDTGELYRNATALLEKVKAIPGLQDVTSDMLLKNPQLNVKINRDQASALGVTAYQIERALSDAYGSTQVSIILAPNNQYQVILELLPEYQANPASVEWLYIRSTTGQLVPIKAVADLSESTGPMTINHSGQLPSVTISFNLIPGFSIGPTVDQINALARENLPPTISTGFQGTAQAFQTSLKGMNVLLLLAVLVIYLVLGILYENFYHPITILTALPFAGFGALLTLKIFHADLSLYAYVGIIMLVGLVKKNGIMMIDFAIETQRAGGKTPTEAIHEACLIRFRPIMMTTMCALMAGLPIAMGFGAGAEARRPLGLAVVGGLVFSQSLTLYVTPVFYVYMEKFQGFMRRLGYWAFLVFGLPIVLGAGGYLAYVYLWAK
ncbi:MAG: efflux RND transporter permease subunit [Planctomycetota bacterium]|nr:efflux RND transporter permease subunit [Planctomycetota bacterium]